MVDCHGLVSKIENDLLVSVGPTGDVMIFVVIIYLLKRAFNLYASIRMAQILKKEKRLTIPNAGKNAEHLELSYTAGRLQITEPLSENSFAVSYRVTIQSSNPALI